MIPDVMIMSTHAWKKLNEQERKWLQQAVDESVVVQREEWRKSEEESLAAVKEAGVEVIIPDKAPFMAKVENVFDLYKSSPDVYNLIQQIRATKPITEQTDTISSEPVITEEINE